MKEHDLSANARALYLKAKHAYEIGNYGYTIQLCQALLKESQGFLDARKLLRAAAINQTKGKKSGGSIIQSTMQGWTSGSTVKKDPIAAMDLAEKTLATDPHNVAANQLLFKAAMEAGFKEVASYALETLVASNNKDTKLLHQLGDHYRNIGENSKASAVYSRITQINPSDLEAMKKSKDASAADTMKSGNWEKAGQAGTSFHDMLKSKEEALARENQAKVVRTTAQIGQQVSEIYAQWDAQQNSIDLSRRLAGLYEQWFEVEEAPDKQEEHLDNAIWYFTHTNTLTNGGDANIARKKTDLEGKKVDRRMKTLEDYLGQMSPEHLEHPDVKPYSDELATLRQQRASGVIDLAKKRVTDNPTDLQLRFELGEVLMNAGKFTDAVPELQRARQNPNVRLKAMNLLGQCFVEKGMYDLAVTQFKTAASEITGMDNLKKDILYKLAGVYEKMDKKADALECLKQIYETDYGYLDVAQRVESSYGG